MRFKKRMFYACCTFSCVPNVAKKFIQLCNWWIHFFEYFSFNALIKEQRFCEVFPILEILRTLPKEMEILAWEEMYR